MDIRACLTEGGLPDRYTRANLAWLAESHRALARNHSRFRAGYERANWHNRWAKLIEDVLEQHHDR